MNFPDNDLLQPLSETPELQAELGKAADLIGHLRNYGTARLRKLIESQHGGVSNEVGIPLIFALGILRWGLELLSSIELQIRDGWTAPAKVTIRSLFECVLAAKFVLEDVEKRYQRALAYIYCELCKERSFLIGRLPDSEAGKKAAALANRDEFGPALLASLPEARIRNRLSEIEQQMASEGMKEIAAEAVRLAPKRKNAAWYEYFGGPGSLEQLADRCGYALSYEVFYRLWSQSAHATAVVRSGIRVRNGTVEILGLRHPSDMEEVKVAAFAFGRELYMAVGIMMPDSQEDFAQWYLEHRPALLRRVNIIASPDAKEA